MGIKPFMKQLFPFALNKKEPARNISKFNKFSYVIDGKEIYDAQSGNYSFQLGFKQDLLIDKVATMMKHNPFARFSMTNFHVQDLNNQLGRITNNDFESVFYSLSGSDAIETAVRAAELYHRKDKKRKHIISFLDSYHGSTRLTSSLTGMNVFSHRLSQYPEEFVHHIPQDNNPQTFIDKVNEIGPENILAIVKEPVSWQSGLLPTSSLYYSTIRDICTQFDIIFILDEIATGMGKSGDWFAYQRLGIEPDIMCIGKGLTSGYFPLSATLFAKKIHRKLDKTYFVNGWTQSPSMAGVYAALATINLIETHGLYNRGMELEKWQSEYYKEWKLEKYRVFGAFGACYVRDMDEMGNIVSRLEDAGVLVTGYRYDPIIRFVFPINIDKNTFDKIMRISADIINE